jgi:lipopolysaccharide export system permease protein
MKMTILDRYLIRKFLFNLLFAMIAFVVVFLVVDLIENVDKFIDRDTGIAKVLLYYGYYIPYIISLTLPVSMLLACLFALGSMSQNNEIVAQKSSGVSLYRIFMPLFVLGLIISVLSGFFNEIVVPEANEQRMDLYRYEIQNNPRSEGSKRNNIFLQDSKNRKVSIAFFNGITNEALNVSVQYFNGATLSKRIDAKKMKWIGQHWVLFDAVERVFHDTTESVSTLPEWAPEDFEFKPENLLEIQKQPEEMSYTELKEFVNEMQKIGGVVRKWDVELDLKIAYPFANFIIILFGAPIAAQKRRSGTAVGIGISLMVCFIYFLFIRTGQVLGHQGTLSPVLGAWMGNIIFGLAGIYTLLKVRK